MVPRTNVDCDGCLAPHYLMHLLREKLVDSKSRVIFVSSGAVRSVPDPSTFALHSFLWNEKYGQLTDLPPFPATLDVNLKGGSGASGYTVYSETKFANLLAAHWWRRQLRGQCDVLAVSPGLIPNTGLGRNFNNPNANLPDAKSVPEGEFFSGSLPTHAWFPSKMLTLSQELRASYARSSGTTSPRTRSRSS